MQIIPRYLRQFSLRGLFVVMTLAALFFGMHVRKVREYQASVLLLRARGIGLGCTHPEALGPDFLYDWELWRLPMSFVSNWYQEYLRIEVHDMALVRDMTLRKSDTLLLAKIPFKYGINFRNSTFEPDAIESMAQCCRFDQIAFVDTPLTRNECEQLCLMTGLKKIWLEGTSQSEEVVAIVQQKLPSCKILLE